MSVRSSIAATLAVAALLGGMSAPALAQPCSGCGCKGGPGYRGPNGRCVGWAELARTCVSPPTTYCKAEGPNRSADEVAAGSRRRTGGAD